MPNLRVSERKKSKFLCNLARQNKYESLLEGEYKFSRLHTKKLHSHGLYHIGNGASFGR